jgi:hypothetical protein
VQYGTLKPADHPLGKGSERLVVWHATYQKSNDFHCIHAQMISRPLTNVHFGIQYANLLKEWLAEANRAQGLIQQENGGCARGGWSDPKQGIGSRIFSRAASKRLYRSA